MMEGVNSTMIYCKNFCKCHNVPSAQERKEGWERKKAFGVGFYVSESNDCALPSPLWAALQ
jgi:hypothetical protein